MTYPDFVAAGLRRVSFAAACVRSAAVDVLPRWLVVVALALLLAGLVGCAAGRAPGGGVVVGFDVASLPQNAGEVVASASRFLPEPWASLGVGVGSLLGGGALYGVGRRAAHAERDRADAEWLDGQRSAPGGPRPPAGA